MVITKRERTMLMTMGIVVGAAFLYYVIISPYLDYRWAKQDERNHAVQVKTTAQAMLDARPQLERKLREYQDRGFRPPDEAGVREGALITTWSKASGLTVELKVLRPVDEAAPMYTASEVVTAKEQNRSPKGKLESQFRVVTITLTGTGSMGSVGQFLKLVETSAEPIRLQSVALTSKHEGTDEVGLTMTITTLCENPGFKPQKAPGADKKSVAAAGGSV